MNDLKKYSPELVHCLMGAIFNIVLVIACAFTVLTLFQLSHSFHSLWAILMLLGLKSFSFKRD